MDILQVCPFTFGEVGGVSEHVRNISSRLAKRHAVTVYVTDSRKRFPKVELVDGVKVVRFRRYAPSNAYFLSGDMLLALRKASYDIVHAHAYHAFPMHFATLAKCKRFVVTPHFHGAGHSTFRNSLVMLLKPFGKRTLRLADKIVAVSEYEKNLIYSQFGFDSDKVVVVPNGVSLREFSGLKRNDHDGKHVLFVGNLFEYKGAQYLVEVLPKLGQDVVLQIVGRGPFKRFLEKRAEALNVRDRVEFYDYLSRKDLLQKYVDSDLFVLLSRYEAYSLVVAEALVAGTPCIVANTSALREWINNQTVFGIGFPINLGELSKTIAFVIGSDKPYCVTMRRMGNKILDWDDVTTRLEAIYQSTTS